VFGLILASAGLACVTAYSVTQRRREIGIRIALGAQSRDVHGLVMKEGAVLVAVGTVIGLAGAGAGIRLSCAGPQLAAHRPGGAVAPGVAEGRSGRGGPTGDIILFRPIRGRLTGRRNPERSAGPNRPHSCAADRAAPGASLSAAAIQ